MNTTTPKDTLLIIDDIPGHVTFLVEFLMRTGFQVLKAQDGEQGLQLAEEAHPDLILLDVLMSGMDGFEVCRRLKSQQNTKAIPVIFMTALTDTVNQVKGFELGAADYLTKPFQLAEALARIKTHLTLRKQQQQLAKQNQQLQQEIAVRKQAETARQERKQTLSAILNAATESIFLIERDGTCVTLNSTAAARLGATVEEIEEQCFYDFLPPEVATRRKALIDKVILTKTAATLEDEKAGLWLESKYYPVINEDGVVTRVAILARDITKRKQAENLLRLQRDLGMALSSTNNLTALLNLVLETALKINEIDCGGVYLVDSLTGELELVAHQGLSPAFVAQTSHYNADSPQAQLLKSDKPIYVHCREIPELKDICQSLRIITSIPVSHNGQVIAAINLASCLVEEFSLNTRNTIEAIATQVSDVIARLKMEEALKQSEARYRAIVENQTELVCRFLPDTTLTFVNEAYCHYFNIQPKDVLGKTFLSRLPEQAHQLLLEHIQSLLNNPQLTSKSHEHQVIAPDGKISWQRWTNRVILDGAGAVMEFQSVGIDITERKQAEEKRRESEARLAEAQRIAHLGHWERNLITNEIQWSDEIFRIFGLSPDKTTLTFETFINAVHPDDRENVQQAMAQAIHHDKRYLPEFRIVLPTGRIRYIQSIGQVIRDATGKPLRLLGTLQNITKRQQLEEALRHSERFARSTIDALSAHLCVLNETGTIVTVNRAWRNFADSNPAVSQNVAEGANYLAVCDAATGDFSKEAQTMAAGIRAVIKGEREQFSLEYSCHSPTEKRWFLGKVTRFYGNPPTYVVVAHENITERQLAEKALRESEQRLSTILNASTDSIALIERDGTCVTINPAGATNLGVTVDELKDQCIYDFFPSAVAEKAIIDKVISLGQSIRFEDNRAGIWSESHCHPVFNQNGEVIRVVVMARDITERKQAEEALRESEERYRRIIETANEGVWFIDADNITTFVNQNMADMLGYTEAEMRGKSLFEFMDQQWQKPAAHHVERCRQGLAEQHDFKFQRQDGTALWVIINTCPLFEKSGQYTGAFGMVTDITERKQMEEALRRSEERFELAMRGANDGVWDWNIETHEIYLSPRWKQILGFAEYEFNSHKAEDALNRLHPDDRPRTMAAINTYLDKKTPAYEHHFRLQHKDGHYVWILARGTAVWNEQGKAVRFVGTHRDLTAQKQTEEELRQQQEFLRLVIDTVPQFIFWKDIKNIYLGCNRKFAQAAGVSAPEEIVGKTDFELPWTPEETALYRAVDRRVMDSDTPEYHTIETIRFAEAQQIWVESNKIPLHDTTGKVIGILGSFEDITERKQAQEKLRQSEARLAEAQRIAHLGHWKWDRMTGILEWSEEVFKHYGVPYVSTNQVSVETFIEAIHPEDRGDVEQQLEQAFYQNQPFKAEFRIVQPNGTVRYNQSFGEAIYDKEAKRSHIFGTSQDITERKQVELNLQQSKAALEQANLELNRFKTTLDLTLDCVFMTDAQTFKFIYANQGATKLLGYTQQELLQMRPQDVDVEFSTERDGPLIEALLSNSILSETLESVYRHKQGTLIPVEVFIQCIRLTDKLIHFVAIARNITERKQAQAKLQQALNAAEIANHAKSAFLANMSHELRTPLNAILGYTQFFHRDKTLSAEQQEGINIIHRNGEYLLTLINDILDISKIEAGKLELDLTEFSLDDFLNGIIDLFRMRAENQKIEFKYEQLSRLPRAIHADEKRLRQILINLLSNAVKFTKQGSVTLKVSVIGDNELIMGNRDLETAPGDTIGNSLPITNEPLPMTKIRFQVEDTGIGIAPSELEKIFLPFEQVGDSNYKAAGTGLGLSITKKLVEMMGGKLHVESVLGQGCTFCVELNLQVSEAALPVQTQEALIIGFEGPPRKILVVDDNAENRLVLINLLISLGFEVKEADSGQESLEKAREWRPDLILMDLMMPGIDGFEATRRIKQIQALQNVVIIAISASVFKQYQQKSSEAGCDDFIHKPISTKVLTELLQVHLNLTWIYETNDKATPNESAAPNSTAPVKGPNAEQAATLYNLSLCGDIDGITNYMKQLEQQDGQLAPFAQQIYQLTDQLAIKQIRQIAKHYMNSTGKPVSKL
jgi:PAS domain S-box-containing protein